MTAETAVALPAFMLILAVALWAVGASSAQVACVDAARSGARAAARGEPPAAVRSAVLRAAPRGSRVAVVRDPMFTRVIVRVEFRPPLPHLLPSLELRAQAVAATEPSAAGEGPPGPAPPAGTEWSGPAAAVGPLVTSGGPGAAVPSVADRGAASRAADRRAGEPARRDAP